MISVKEILSDLNKLSDEEFANLSISTRRLFEYKLRALEYSELEELLVNVPSTSQKRSYINGIAIEQAQRLAFKEKKEAERLVKNETIEELLELYNNKKSGRVQEARKKIQHRYPYLSYKEQLVIMRTFLKGGKTERLWGYNILRNLWSEDFKDDVLELWLKYKEERCGWLLIKYFSTDEIRPFVDDLSTRNSYYNLCKKLVKEEWFSIDINLLKQLPLTHEEFIWIVSQSKNGISEEEAMSYVYRNIAYTLCGLNVYTYPDGQFAYGRNIYYYPPKIDDLFYMRKIIGMDNMLTSICRMGYDVAVRKFLELDQSIHDSIIDMYYEDEVGGDQRYEAIVREWLAEYRAKFPKEYRYILDNNSGTKPVKRSYIRNRPITEEEYNQMAFDNESFNALVEQFKLEVPKDEETNYADDPPF
ncbi:MAG: hypothetical protein MJY95_07505 [Bacteroidaceae bacterium]|nr:hypothetical protein [Bacteroidaceae bacterium]